MTVAVVIFDVAAKAGNCGPWVATARSKAPLMTRSAIFFNRHKADSYNFLTSLAENCDFLEVRHEMLQPATMAVGNMQTCTIVERLILNVGMTNAKCWDDMQ